MNRKRLTDDGNTRNIDCNTSRPQEGSRLEYSLLSCYLCIMHDTHFINKQWPVAGGKQTALMDSSFILEDHGMMDASSQGHSIQLGSP